MFYFGLSSDGYAREGVAYSNDLKQWQKIDEVLIDVGLEGSIDSRYAHKPGVITKGEILFHFYCAVSPANTKQLGDVKHNEIRGIALATN